MTYVTRITSNLKAGVDAKLGPRTLVTGGSGRGKTTLVEALELALTGRADPGFYVLGLFAEAKLDGGGSCRWKDWKHKVAEGVEGAICLPFREALAAEGPRQRSFFLQHMGAEAESDVFKAIPAGLRARMEQAFGLAEPSSSVVDQLILGMQHALSAGGDARKRLTPLPPAVKRPESDMFLLEDGLARAVCVRRRAEAALSRREVATKAGARLRGLKETLRVRVAEFQEIQLRLAAAKATETSSDELAELHAEEKESWVSVERIRADLGRVYADIEIGTMGGTELVPSVAAQEENRASRRLSDAYRAWNAFFAYEAAAKETERLKSEIADWDLLADACNHALSRILDSNLSRFVAEVQRYLPPGETFDLQLRGDLSFGLLRGGVLHSDLSSAERARVRTAIAAAIAPKGGLSVIAVDEPLGDPATITAVMKALASSTAQVIICSSVLPSEIPEGWTHVSLDPEPPPPPAPPEPPSPPPEPEEPDIFDVVPAIERKARA